MATAHLSDAQLRSLVIHGIDNSLFSVNDTITDPADANRKNVSARMSQRWRKENAASPKAVAAARAFCNHHFANNALPAQFAAAPAAPAPAAPADDNDAPAADDNDEQEKKQEEEEEEEEEKKEKEEEKKKEEADETEGDDVIAPQTYRICTWNLLNYGSKTEEKRKTEIQDHLAKFDVIAVQEVVGKQLADVFPSARLEAYEWKHSQKTGNGRKEALGFLYDKSRLSSVNKPRLLDDVACAYKPFLITLECAKSRDRFSLLNCHVSFAGNNIDARRAEVAALAIKVAQLRQKGAYAQLYVCGDFNLTPHDAAFDAFRALGYVALNTKEPTNTGETPQIYDNIWVPANSMALHNTVAVNTFPHWFVRSDKDSRAEFAKMVGNHLPVSVSVRTPAY
jgi:hypothetical protein